MIEPLGDILLLHTWSGAFHSRDERTTLAYPSIVVFDDGRIVAGSHPDLILGAEPEYRSEQLADEDFDVLVEQVRAAFTTSFSAGIVGSGGYCADCGTAIYRADHGETVEIAAFRLLTNGPPGYAGNALFPPELLELDGMLGELAEHVEGSGEPYSERFHASCLIERWRVSVAGANYELWGMTVRLGWVET